MNHDFCQYEEIWRDALQQFVRTLDSSAFQGDAPRERMKDELTQTLDQSKKVLLASKDVREAMESVHMLIDGNQNPSARKMLRL